jgi:hypothetical protein
MLAFKESHSLAMHYCRLVWDVRSLSSITDINNNEKTGKDSHEEETNVKEQAKSVNDVRKITVL